MIAAAKHYDIVLGTLAVLSNGLESVKEMICSNILSRMVIVVGNLNASPRCQAYLSDEDPTNH